MANTSTLTAEQVQQFQNDGFLIVRDVISDEAVKPLIHDLEELVENLTSAALDQGILDQDHTYTDSPFAQRLAQLGSACSESNWIWKEYRKIGKLKTPGVFHLRRHPDLLDIIESLIGPEILAHPQYAVRAKLPDHMHTEVPWHQDMGYLSDDDASNTLIVNCWIPLVPATAQNGCLQILCGSNHCGNIPHEKFTDDPDTQAPVGIRDENLPEGEVITCEVDVGDVLLTMERVVHRSLTNKTDGVRWSIDSRYCGLGLPTGRNEVPGFVARSDQDPQRITQSYEEWIRIFTDSGIDLAR